MTTAIIIIFCTLLLIAYLFDLTFDKTKIPSVILLLLLGWIMKQVTLFLKLQLPDFSRVLAVSGSIGLILIVLEGALELELNKSKISLIKKSFFGALLSMFALAFLLAYIFSLFENYSFKDCLTNAIPFCVVSSAIAIPSVKNLRPYDKEYIIYESSLSDIFSVLFFNFVVQNSFIGLHSFGNFGLQILIIIIVSFVATIGLSYLLNKIEHQIKFVPIILLVILIYEVSVIYNLPSLIFIMMFGLFLGNLNELKRFKWIEKFRPTELNTEVQRFKGLTIEAAFLIRSLFFLFFGYSMETAEILNTDTLLWSFGIVAVIFVFRAIQLKLSRLPLKSLLFVSPRGLITILLFLSIPAVDQISIVNKSLIIQVILLTTLIMMVALMISSEIKKKKPAMENIPEISSTKTDFKSEESPG
ncbi:MAG: cation:proton antiporter [Bacteroidota bacterium]|nr:cation:proton antiporter [Bacteroidota bacterium]